MSRLRRRPNRCSNHSTSGVAASDPIAMAVKRSPKPAAPSPMGPGSMTKSGKIANCAVKTRLEMPTQMARVRSTRWPNR